MVDQSNPSPPPDLNFPQGLLKTDVKKPNRHQGFDANLTRYFHRQFSSDDATKFWNAVSQLIISQLQHEREQLVQAIRQLGQDDD